MEKGLKDTAVQEERHHEKCCRHWSAAVRAAALWSGLGARDRNRIWTKMSAGPDCWRVLLLTGFSVIKAHRITPAELTNTPSKQSPCDSETRFHRVRYPSAPPEVSLAALLLKTWRPRCSLVLMQPTVMWALNVIFKQQHAGLQCFAKTHKQSFCWWHGHNSKQKWAAQLWETAAGRTGGQIPRLQSDRLFLSVCILCSRD